jgi:PhnB protein
MSKGSVTITPHLVCRNAGQAVEFYKNAFGAQPQMVSRMENGKVMHATLSIGDAQIYLCDEFPDFENKSPETLGGSPIVIHLKVDDCDAWFQRAVDAGCTVTMPLEDQFWGDRYGAVADPYGHKWSIATPKRTVSPEELQKAMAEFQTPATG